MTTKNASPEALLRRLENGTIEWSHLTEAQKDAVHAFCVKLECQKDGFGGGFNQ